MSYNEDVFDFRNHILIDLSTTLFVSLEINPRSLAAGIIIQICY